MIQIDNMLIADDGKTLTEGEGFYSEVYLGNINYADRYTEITIEEMNKILEEQLYMEEILI